MGFEDRLKSKLDSLSIGQRKVGTYILTHLDESSYAKWYGFLGNIGTST